MLRVSSGRCVVGLARFSTSSLPDNSRPRRTEAMAKRKQERRERELSPEEIRINEIMDYAKTESVEGDPVYFAELLMCCGSSSPKARYKAVKMLHAIPLDPEEMVTRPSFSFRRHDTLKALVKFLRVSLDKGFSGRRMCDVLRYVSLRQSVPDGPFNLSDIDMNNVPTVLQYLEEELFPSFRPEDTFLYEPQIFEHMASSSTSSSLQLTEESVRHCRARRLSRGDSLVLFDGSGSWIRATYGTGGGGGGGSSVASVVSRHYLPPPHVRFAVASSLPKGDRADVMVSKLQELGCDEWIALRCARSSDAHSGDGGGQLSETKLQRWSRLCAASCEQSRRVHLMQESNGGEVLTLEQFLSEREPRGCYGDLEWNEEAAEQEEEETGQGRRRDDEEDDDEDDEEGMFRFVEEARGDVKYVQQEMSLVIGPEGGFTAEERKMLKDAQLKPVSFCPDGVLRVETAAIAGLAILRNRFT